MLQLLQNYKGIYYSADFAQIAHIIIFSRCNFAILQHLNFPNEKHHQPMFFLAAFLKLWVQVLFVGGGKKIFQKNA